MRRFPFRMCLLRVSTVGLWLGVLCLFIGVLAASINVVLRTHHQNASRTAWDSAQAAWAGSFWGTSVLLGSVVIGATVRTNHSKLPLTVTVLWPLRFIRNRLVFVEGWLSLWLGAVMCITGHWKKFDGMEAHGENVVYAGVLLAGIGLVLVVTSWRWSASLNLGANDSEESDIDKCGQS